MLDVGRFVEVGLVVGLGVGGTGCCVAIGELVVGHAELGATVVGVLVHGVGLGVGCLVVGLGVGGTGGCVAIGELVVGDLVFGLPVGLCVLGSEGFSVLASVVDE